jgi:hypothetical protein
VKRLLGILVLAMTLAAGCKQQDGAGSGTSTVTGSGSASGPGPGTGAASATDAGSATDSGPPAPAARADVAAFAAVFEPIASRLDHVARARSACEHRKALVDAAGAIDKSAPPAGHDPAAWLAAVEELRVIIDETGDPCDDGDVKGIEAKLDRAKQALAKLAP